jgi:hypothetical protein
LLFEFNYCYHRDSNNERVVLYKGKTMKRKLMALFVIVGGLGLLQAGCGRAETKETKDKNGKIVKKACSSCKSGCCGR